MQDTPVEPATSSSARYLSVVAYGVALFGMVFILRAIEYRFMVRDISVELFASTLAILFSGLGVWVGWKLTHKPTPVLTRSEEPTTRPEAHGISDREYEVLKLIAAGHSNQEIADALFLSLNTIKKHSSSLFTKLGVSRRTQAVEKARALGLI